MRPALRAAWLVVLVGVAPACVLYVDDPPEEADDEPWTPPPDAGVVVDAPWPPQLACDQPVWCPPASAGRTSVCGQLRDVETDLPIRVAGSQGEPCAPGDATGPCGLTITPYDALDFAGNPDGAQPLPAASITRDTCGRFALVDVIRPQLGFLAIAVDDAEGAPDARRLTARAWPVASGQTTGGVNMYALRRSTDQLWSATAGLSPGFVDRGVIFAMFRTLSGPAEGVTLRSSGATRAADDFAFSDPEPFTRAQLDTTLTATGPNGVALMLNSSLVEHTGEGGLQPGCTWQRSLAASIPGALFVLELWGETEAGALCP